MKATTTKLCNQIRRNEETLRVWLFPPLFSLSAFTLVCIKHANSAETNQPIDHFTFRLPPDTAGTVYRYR